MILLFRKQFRSVFYFPMAFEIWSDKRGDLWWDGSY